MMTGVELGRGFGLDARWRLTGRVDGCHVVGMMADLSGTHAPSFWGWPCM